MNALMLTGSADDGLAHLVWMQAFMPFDNADNTNPAASLDLVFSLYSGSMWFVGLT